MLFLFGLAVPVLALIFSRLRGASDAEENPPCALAKAERAVYVAETLSIIGSTQAIIILFSIADWVPIPDLMSSLALLIVTLPAVASLLIGWREAESAAGSPFPTMGIARHARSLRWLAVASIFAAAAGLILGWLSGYLIVATAADLVGSTLAGVFSYAGAVVERTSPSLSAVSEVLEALRDEKAERLMRDLEVEDPVRFAWWLVLSPVAMVKFRRWMELAQDVDAEAAAKKLAELRAEAEELERYGIEADELLRDIEEAQKKMEDEVRELLEIEDDLRKMLRGELAVKLKVAVAA